MAVLNVHVGDPVTDVTGTVTGEVTNVQEPRYRQSDGGIITRITVKWSSGRADTYSFDQFAAQVRKVLTP